MTVVIWLCNRNMCYEFRLFFITCGNGSTSKLVVKLEGLFGVMARVVCWPLEFIHVYLPSGEEFLQKVWF